MIELARVLGQAQMHRSVVLAAVDHEELGFLGARRLVDQLTAQRRVIDAFVFEMLAYTSSAPGSQALPPGIGLLYPGQVRRIRANGMRGDFTAVLYRRSGRVLAVAFAEALAHLAGRSRRSSCGRPPTYRCPATCRTPWTSAGWRMWLPAPRRRSNASPAHRGTADHQRIRCPTVVLEAPFVPQRWLRLPMERIAGIRPRVLPGRSHDGDPAVPR